LMKIHYDEKIKAKHKEKNENKEDRTILNT